MSSRKRTRTDPVDARARYCLRVASQRLGDAAETLEHSAKAMAESIVAATEGAPVTELRRVASSLHAASLQLTGVLHTVIAEGAAIETVAEMRGACT